MIVNLGDPLKKKDLNTSAVHAEEEDDIFQLNEDDKAPPTIPTRAELFEGSKASQEQLIFPKNIHKTQTLKMYDTFGMDKVDESRASPLKIFKYLSKPAENSLYESMDMTIPLVTDYVFVGNNPLLTAIYERVMNEDSYMNQLPSKVLDDTNELLNNEQVNFMNGFNCLGIMFILKKLMDSFEMNLCIENNLNLLQSQSSDPISQIISSSNELYYGSFPKVLSLYNLHLLCSNFNDSILVVSFMEKAFHEFSELKNDTNLRDMALRQLKEYIEESIANNYKEQFFEGKAIVIITKLSKCKTQILFECHVPFLQKGYLSDLIEFLTDELTKKYKHCFNRITSHKIFRYCHMKADDLDLWGYKEFKEGLFYEERIRGGLPYIKPKDGWVRFGLNVTNYYQTDCETDWFGNDGNSKEWAVCYCNIGLDQKLSLLEREVFSDIYNDLEEGNSLIKEKCGFGILATFDLSLFEKREIKESSLGVSSWKKDEKAFEFFNLQSFDIMDVNFKSHGYTLALQCRVDPKKIRFPSRFGQKIFVVNDPKDIRPYGILIKTLE